MSYNVLNCPFVKGAQGNLDLGIGEANNLST